MFSEAIPVFPRQRQSTVAALRASEQRLVQIQATRAESMGRASHVQAPYPVGRIVGDPTCLLGTGLQPLDPVVECQGVVLPQAFDIPNFEAALVPPLEGLC